MVESVGTVPPGHLNEVGHVIVREPVPSCVMNQLIVWPSFRFENVGAVVTLAVNVVVNTFASAQSIAIVVALNVTATGAVYAAVNRPRLGVVTPNGPGAAM